MTITPHQLDTDSLYTKDWNKTWSDDTLDDELTDLIANANSIHSKIDDHTTTDDHAMRDALGDLELDPIEAICEVTHLTYNKNLPRSPWVDADGKQAY